MSRLLTKHNKYIYFFCQLTVFDYLDNPNKILRATQTGDMKNNFHTLCLSLLFPLGIFAQLPANCDAPAPRIIMAGDSWAQYMADDNTHNRVLKMYGQGDKTTISSTFEVGILCGDTQPDASDPYYTVSGSEARQWANEADYNYLQNLIDAINANPTLDAVLLSIGGNDILAGRSEGGWYLDMDLDVAGSEQALFDQITADMLYIMDEVWARARPDINFIISSYDFPNFNVTGSFLGQDYCSFYACGKREDLSRDEDGDGAISGSEHLILDGELNNMMTLVEQIRKDIADANSQIYYDNGQGLMHYYYGFDDPGYPAITEGTTPYPLGVSPFTGGGDPAIPTDRDNFRTVAVCGLGSFPADPIHLDADAYEYKIKNEFDNIFFEEYRGEPTVTYFSEGANDGYVDVIDNAINTSGLRVGDDGWEFPFTSPTNDYRSILSFNTSDIPDDATVTGASLYMIRSGADDNPFEKGDRSPVLDIKSGHFGSNAALELADGTDAADASDIACFHGLVEEDKFTVRADITGSAVDFINKTGTTQFRFSFNVADWSTEYVNFYDGGGVAAAVSPEVAALQNPPVYEYRTVKRVYEADGTETDIEIERGPQITRREGYVYQEKIKDVRENEEGDKILSMAVMVAIEHPGLAKYMSDNYPDATPGGGYAPFLDVQYELALPIDLAYFKANAADENVLLTWQTNAEQNSDFFIVEHSEDNQNWSSIGEEKAASNSRQTIDYQLLHENPTVGKNYYRLQMIDKDGSFNYSEIRTVNFKKGQNILAIYPNPYSTEFTIEADFVAAGNARLEVSDILGRVVAQQELATGTGLQKITLNNLSDLANGTYVLRVFAGNEVYFGKIVKR